MLSEIDPLSKIPLSRPDFAPFDLLRHIQVGIRPLPQNSVEKIFLGYLATVDETLKQAGFRCVLRDHTHSHFCVGDNPSGRPTVKSILSRQFDTLSLVSVRHPIDSFLSLRKKNWVMYEPDTLHEYCRRYLSFLDAYESEPIIKYEDFVQKPDWGVRYMASVLDLPYSQDWRTILPKVMLSGDSGRSGRGILERPRRPVPIDIIHESKVSDEYIALCERLDYNPDLEME